MKKIKWGIIGLGDIANKFARTIKEMNSSELKAVASRSKDKAENFGRHYGVALDSCYGSYEEIVKDEEIDVIYVAVPHVFHKEVSILCLKNGKAVLCEKPITVSEAEIREVVSVAEENKVFFMEAMKTRFLPINKKVKQLVDEGLIGEVRLLQADFGFKAPFDRNSRLYDKNLGGGALLDVGIYNVSYAAFLFGNTPKSIKSNAYIGETGVDECISINLGYEGGKQAQLYAAINLATIREANIIGTKGRICVPRFSNAEEAYIITSEGDKKLNMPFSINGFEYQIEEVERCLREGNLQSEIMSHRDSIEIMRIMDKIRRKKL